MDESKSFKLVDYLDQDMYIKKSSNYHGLSIQKLKILTCA